MRYARGGARRAGGAHARCAARGARARGGGALRGAAPRRCAQLFALFSLPRLAFCAGSILLPRRARFLTFGPTTRVAARCAARAQRRARTRQRVRRRAFTLPAALARRAALRARRMATKTKRHGAAWHGAAWRRREKHGMARHGVAQARIYGAWRRVAQNNGAHGAKSALTALFARAQRARANNGAITRLFLTAPRLLHNNKKRHAALLRFRARHQST